MSICRSCQIDKEEEQFRADLSRKSGRRGICLLCERAARAEYARDYRAKNPECNRQHCRKHYVNNKDSFKDYYQKNRESILENKGRDYHANLELSRETGKLNMARQRLKRPGAIRQRSQEWLDRNPVKKKAYQAQGYRRFQKSAHLRLHHSVSGMVRVALKEAKHSGWERLLGYTVQILKSHLEGQFAVGMNWENYGSGGWEVDHIVPRCAFRFEEPSDTEFQLCWMLKNLRPVWRLDNLKKVPQDLRLQRLRCRHSSLESFADSLLAMGEEFAAHQEVIASWPDHLSALQL